MNSSWLVPTAVIAMIGLLMQGVKATWDLYLSVKAHNGSRTALQLQEINAFMHLLDGLPLSSARRALWKVKLAGIIQRKQSASSLYAEMNALLVEITGEYPEPETGTSVLPSGQR